MSHHDTGRGEVLQALLYYAVCKCQPAKVVRHRICGLKEEVIRVSYPVLCAGLGQTGAGAPLTIDLALAPYIPGPSMPRRRGSFGTYAQLR